MPYLLFVEQNFKALFLTIILIVSFMKILLLGKYLVVTAW